MSGAVIKCGRVQVGLFDVSHPKFDRARRNLARAGEILSHMTLWQFFVPLR